MPYAADRLKAIRNRILIETAALREFSCLGRQARDSETLAELTRLQGPNTRG